MRCEITDPGYCVAEADSGGSGESPDQVEQLVLLAPHTAGEDVQLGHGDVPGVEAEVQHSEDSLPASQESVHQTLQNTEAARPANFLLQLQHPTPAGLICRG